MPAQNTNSAPDTSTNELMISGASPQMLASLLIGVILFGVVVSGAYIATRRSLGGEPAVAAAPVQASPSPLPVAPPPAVSAPRPQAVAITAEETRGKTFLQVGAIERSVAPRFLEELAGKGFSARVAEGPDAGTVRILVGPLSGAALTGTQAKLTTAGVVSFIKGY